MLPEPISRSLSHENKITCNALGQDDLGRGFTLQRTQCLVNAL
jgi:hypothetical protein